MEPRKLIAEALGTALLVFVGVGVATLSFGFKAAGLSTSAGIVATALAFGLVLVALAYTLGPITGAHVNPAVTMGFVASGRMSLNEAVGYWIAQFVGAFGGAAMLWAIFEGSPIYSTSRVGLGTNGWGKASMIHIDLGGAFAAEFVLTFIFVMVVLIATSRIGSAGFAGLVIGFGLLVVHLVGIPLTGTSVNPARSLGPAIIVGGEAIRQVWLFIVAPLLGGMFAAVVYRYFVPDEGIKAETAVAEGDVERTAATP